MEGKEVINEKHEGREEENHQVWNRTWDETQIHGYIREWKKERKKGRWKDRILCNKHPYFNQTVIFSWTEISRYWMQLQFYECMHLLVRSNFKDASMSLNEVESWWMYQQLVSSFRVCRHKPNSTEESWENIYNARGTSSAEIQLVVCLYCVMYVDFKVWCPCFFCVCFLLGQPWLGW